MEKYLLMISEKSVKSVFMINFASVHFTRSNLHYSAHFTFYLFQPHRGFRFFF